MGTALDKEINNIKNRLYDLYEKSYNQNIYTFSNFLGLSDLDIFYRYLKDFDLVKPVAFGGYDESERKVVRFGDPESFGYEVDFPIVCINIKPVIAKFADSLSHRDYLGALMNLGIDRSTIGDIKISGNEAFCFCLDSISDYICDNLDKVKRTVVKCTIVEKPEDIPKEEPKRCICQVPSLRVDACISKVYNISRSDCLLYFRECKVYVNGRSMENNSKILSAGDCVNLRGYGKFKLVSEPKITKKGKLSIEVDVFK